MPAIKAIVAAVAAGAGAFGTAASDGRITLVEWGVIVAAVAGTFGAVYAAPANTTPPAGK